MKPPQSPATVPVATDFDAIAQLIRAARQRALQAVNTTLIELYGQIGEHISRKIAAAEWGAGVVDELAGYLARTQPGQRGFTRANLFRMRQFYEAYPDPAFVSAVLRQIPWTHHLLILGQSKQPEEREFYLRMAVREQWSSRDLQRQIKAALFERTVLSPPKVSPVARHIHPEIASVFKDSYVVEFLDLQPGHAEADLHRRLNSLVAFELKVGRFEPEQLGKLNFYLEALDRDVKKPHEQPAIGVLLRASKDDEVVEYAMSRSHSPALMADDQTQLPDKALLRAKLHEFDLQNTQDLDAPTG